ncbi:hypothetical protein BB558_003476 [Smittium angustum]|uniref:UDP-galactose transporter n=1 Tax=Smittium angustum TaxID=133377 RepID=A0A2U1J688_SMIAN|nr:hypothetical protein BB558_003476 [Smittium angustum]
MEKKILGISLKYLSLVILVVQNSLLVIVMRYSRTVSDVKYYASTAVFFSEMFKLLVSLVIFYREEYVAVSNLDPATFQVSYQLKILTTALCSVILLKTILGPIKWSSLFLLTLGVALVQLETQAPTASTSKKLGNIQKFQGLVAVGMACFLSGLSGVYFELVLKSTTKSLWLRNVQLSLYSLVPAIVGILFVDGTGIANNGFLYGYTGWTVGAIMCQSVGGLIVAVVVKYADNILKGFATSISIILSCVLSYFIFDFQFSFMFAIGTSFVIYSTYLYGTTPTIKKTPHTCPDENNISEDGIDIDPAHKSGYISLNPIKDFDARKKAYEDAPKTV